MSLKPCKEIGNEIHWHNVINVGDKDLKLYTIYSPPNHPDGTVHKTLEEAQKAEGNEHH